MSTTAILQALKALPANEQEKVLRELSTWQMDRLEKKQAEEGAKKPWPDFDHRASEIYGDKTLPNLVLMARSEQPW